MLVAEREGELIGLGIMDLEKQTINALYVHPKAAGAGVGKKLLLEMERKAAENGLNNLTLNSTVNARAFYEKHGYTGSEKNFHELPNGVRLECIGMHKKIGP